MKESTNPHRAPAFDSLLTPKQAAHILQMSPKFVRDHQDELGAIRMGGGATRAGRLRFQREAIDRFIRQNGNRKRGSHAETNAKPNRMAG